ncbi:MAG: hypothetical protein ACREB6_14900 [Rhodospirillales bacterium]
MTTFEEKNSGGVVAAQGLGRIRAAKPDDRRTTSGRPSDDREKSADGKGMTINDDFPAPADGATRIGSTGWEESGGRK